ncbi:MAG: monovalent cation/H(+) antiporter subunit G [Chloroflexota bacterium]
MLESALGIIGSGLVMLGLTLATIGLYGLLRKPDIFHQLHAAGLVTNAAVLLVLLASVATGSAEIITSAILVGGFVLVTSPPPAMPWHGRHAAGASADGRVRGPHARRGPCA